MLWGCWFGSMDSVDNSAMVVGCDKILCSMTSALSSFFSFMSYPPLCPSSSSVLWTSNALLHPSSLSLVPSTHTYPCYTSKQLPQTLFKNDFSVESLLSLTSRDNAFFYFLLWPPFFSVSLLKLFVWVAFSRRRCSFHLLSLKLKKSNSMYM